MQPTSEAVAWAERADAWAERPPEGGQGGQLQQSRWSEVAETGRPAFPADGVGWRTETAEWRATEQTARWRQTTEWRSASGTHGWRSTTEAWQTGAGAEDFRPPTDPPTRQQTAISGTAWPTPTGDEPSGTISDATEPPTDNGQANGWQRFTESAAPWQPSSESRPAWQQFTAPPAPWDQGGGTPPNGDRPRRTDAPAAGSATPSWQQLVEPDPHSRAAGATINGAAAGPLDAGRHLVREDDRARWRRDTASFDDGTRQGGRRRAPEPGSRTSGGTGWSTRSDSDNWAGHADTGSIQMFDESAVTDAPSWGTRSEAPDWRRSRQGEVPSSAVPSWQQPDRSPGWQQPETPGSAIPSWQQPAAPGSAEPTWQQSAAPGSAVPSRQQPEAPNAAPSWQQPETPDSAPPRWQESGTPGNAVSRWQPSAESPGAAAGWQPGRARPETPGTPSWQQSGPAAIGWQGDDDSPGRRGGGSAPPAWQDDDRRREGGRRRADDDAPGWRDTTSADSDWRSTAASGRLDEAAPPGTGAVRGWQDGTAAPGRRGEALGDEAPPGRRADEATPGWGGRADAPSWQRSAPPAIGWQRDDDDRDEPRSRRRDTPAGWQQDRPGGPAWRRDDTPSRHQDGPGWRQDDRVAPAWRQDDRTGPGWRQDDQGGPSDRQDDRDDRDGPRWRQDAPGWRQDDRDAPGWLQDDRDAPSWRQDDREAPSWRQDDRDAQDWRQDDRDPQGWREDRGPGPGRRSSRQPDDRDAQNWRPNGDTPAWRQSREITSTPHVAGSPTTPADRDAPAWRQDGRGAPGWQDDDPSGRRREYRDRPGWEETGSVAGNRRRAAAPADPWAHSAADTGVIPFSGEPPATDTGSWRPAAGAIGRARPSNPNRRRDEVGDTSSRIGDTSSRIGRRRAEPDAVAPVDPEIFRREPGMRTDAANWPAEDAQPDWRRQLQAEQEPSVGDAVTEVRQRIDPEAWQRDEREQATRGTATYREGNTGDWRRELAAESSSNLADGESRRFGTQDFVPFRPVGSAAVAPVSAPVRAPAEPAARREELLVRNDPDAGPAEAPEQWPPRRPTGYQGPAAAYASAATGTYERRPVGGGLATAPGRPNDLLEPDEDELEEETGGPLAAVGYTVIWYGVPVVLFVLYMLVLNNSQQAHALSTLAEAAPQFGLSLVLSMVVAVGLRWASGSWKAASVGLAAAVMGGGLATVLSSAITGNSLS